MRLPPISALPGMLWLCARIDARRPASWIALAIGAWIGGWASGGPAWWPAWWAGTSPAATQIGGGMALVSAALAAAAAVGDLPLDLIAPRRSRVWAGVWACERTLWPLVGLLVGGLTAGSSPSFLGGMAGGLVGLPLAALMLASGRSLGATAAGAASLTIVVASASAAAYASGAARAESFGLGCGVAVWLVLGGLAWGWPRTSAATVNLASASSDRSARGRSDVLSVDPLPSSGPLRRILVRLAMVTALVAMAGWLGVANVDVAGRAHNGHAGRDAHAEQVGQATVAWAVLSAACFLGLAVPQATLLDGTAGVGGWERLLGTAARSRRAEAGLPFARRSRASLPLGRARFAGGVALTQAAILGWPAVLCAVLSVPAPARAALPLAIVIGLLVAAGLLVTAVAVGAAVGASRETVFAAVLAGVVVAGTALLPSPPASPGPVVSRAAPADWGALCSGRGPGQRTFVGCVEKSCPEER
ncbi:MAG: hypothetical protein ACKOHG_15985 [Planctomycetia bacterium]